MFSKTVRLLRVRRPPMTGRNKKKPARSGVLYVKQDLMGTNLVVMTVSDYRKHCRQLSAMRRVLFNLKRTLNVFERSL